MADDNVIKLRPKTLEGIMPEPEDIAGKKFPEPSLLVVATLERMLERAKRGELRSMVTMIETHSGDAKIGTNVERLHVLPEDDTALVLIYLGMQRFQADALAVASGLYDDDDEFEVVQ